MEPTSCVSCNAVVVREFAYCDENSDCRVKVEIVNY